jgi:ubiquinol-cytochrome c reductase cytochrome c subunit
MTASVSAGCAATRPSTRRRRSSAAVLLLALIATGVTWALLAPRGSAAERADSNEAVRAGRALFLQGCSSCHGMNAEGGTQAPSLIGVGTAAVQFQVGTGRMPLAAPGAEAKRKPPEYSQTQIDQLGAYIDSLGGGPAAANVSKTQLADADLAYGGELFRANCAQCHQAVGQGAPLTYGKYAPSLSKATADDVLNAMRTGPESMPVFGSRQVSDSQAVAIAAYVHAVTHAKSPGGNRLGSYGPVPEGIVAFVIGLGGLLVAALWIGARQKV